MADTRLPTIIIPYKWPVTEPSHQDIFVYLRPETNGVRVESLLLGIIRKDPLYRDNISVAYLANIPGDFILTNRIIEQHYADRIYFARRGKQAFTPHMRRVFEEFFSVGFDEANIIGAFEALHRRKWSWDELFKLWVDQKDFCTVNGQTVKRVDEFYIINYDIPALLHKNNEATDIAVMIFRSKLDSASFAALVAEFRRGLVDGGVLSAETPLSHALHYSKSPFEQILDAEGYLYFPGGTHCSLEQIRYAAWLVEHGISREMIHGILHHPIMQFRLPDGGVAEEHLFVYTAGDSYDGALAKLKTAVSQLLFL